MTVKEAQKELISRALVFGDDRQIEALAVLRKVEDCKEAILGCEYVYEHLACGKSDLMDCDCIDKWDMWDGDEDGIIGAALLAAKKTKK